MKKKLSLILVSLGLMFSIMICATASYTVPNSLDCVNDFQYNGSNNEINSINDYLIFNESNYGDNGADDSDFEFGYPGSSIGVANDADFIYPEGVNPPIYENKLNSNQHKTNMDEINVDGRENINVSGTVYTNVSLLDGKPTVVENNHGINPDMVSTYPYDSYVPVQLDKPSSELNNCNAADQIN